MISSDEAYKLINTDVKIENGALIIEHKYKIDAKAMVKLLSENVADKKKPKKSIDEMCNEALERINEKLDNDLALLKANIGYPDFGHKALADMLTPYIESAMRPASFSIDGFNHAMSEIGKVSQLIDFEHPRTISHG